jgi:hypothetical protein
MLNTRTLFVLAAAAIVGASCSRYTETSAAGDVIPTADAAKTVVLHVDNRNPAPMELRAFVNGRSFFVGSVSGQDSTSILLDPTLFPTANLYLAAIPTGGQGQARVGPLGAGKGDVIKFTIQPALDLSQAIVVR